VAANITEAWRKRRYEGAFIAKLSDAETEAAETQTWLRFAHRCGYLAEDQWRIMEDEYEQIIRMLVSMMVNSEKWLL
jgi:four helix bundle protein